jgi:vacuolar-type H+-ATPase subunit E/Vma4
MLERIRAGVCEQLPGVLAGDPELRRALVAAALACVGDEPGILRCSPLLVDIAREASPAAIRVEAEPGVATGVVIELATGTRIDATLATLLDRVWPTLACEALQQERTR